MTIRGRGRPWGEKLKAKEKRTVLVGLRITPEDAKRLDAILAKLDEPTTASSYAYGALLAAMQKDERRTERARRPRR